MSKLTYNERALKGLLDHYNYYADKLVEDAVYESFLTIVNNAKKLLGNKPEMKVKRILTLTLTLTLGFSGRSRRIGNANRTGAFVQRNSRCGSTGATTNETTAESENEKDQISVESKPSESGAM